MKLQIWAEVEFDGAEEDAVNEYIATIQSEYPSLSGLVSDFVDGADRSKVIVTLERRRVVLALHPRMICPECKRDMKKAEVGRFLFRCFCGHVEGDLEK